MKPELPPGDGNVPSGPVQPDRLHPVEWAATAGAGGDVLRQMERHLVCLRRRRSRVAGAAAAALLVTATVLWWRGAQPGDGARADAVPPSIVVSVPTRRVLDDGTQVELRAGAELHVAFSAAFRRVVLERGEAHFTVTRDSARPFVVRANGLEVRAVGTAFAVQVGEKEVEVVVTEGRVALDSPASDEAGSTRSGVGSEPSAEAPRRSIAFVEAGGRAVVAPVASDSGVSAHVAKVTTAEMAARLAWREPTLELSGTPLREAIPMFNRHGGVRLVLGDPLLGRVRLSGVVRGSSIEPLLRLLEEEHGIVASPRANGELVLTKDP